ncbi:MAG TPA: hypothetical protein VE591_12895, partial [Candidatus Acidoferrum sp.]|nr:hypothetical protein [Candidatus Acidoferrum sp.]
KQNVALDWSTPSGFETRIDAEHLDNYNGLNRAGYILANGFFKYTASRRVTFALGVYNLFDTDSQIYDFIGAGSFQAQNQFGTAANAFQENNVKLRGLTPRSIDFSITTKI